MKNDFAKFVEENFQLETVDGLIPFKLNSYQLALWDFFKRNFDYKTEERQTGTTTFLCLLSLIYSSKKNSRIFYIGPRADFAREIKNRVVRMRETSKSETLPKITNSDGRCIEFDNGARITFLSKHEPHCLMNDITIVFHDSINHSPYEEMTKALARLRWSGVEVLSVQTG